jgi:hypothetical protein
MMQSLLGHGAGDHARDLLVRDSGGATSRGRERGEACIRTAVGPKFGFQL